MLLQSLTIKNYMRNQYKKVQYRYRNISKFVNALKNVFRSNKPLLPRILHSIDKIITRDGEKLLKTVIQSRTSSAEKKHHRERDAHLIRMDEFFLHQ